MAKELDRFDVNARKNVSLKTKLIAMIVGASILGVVITGAVSLKIFDNGLIQNAEMDINNISNGVNFIIDDWIDNLYRYANMLSMEPSTKSFFTVPKEILPRIVPDIKFGDAPGIEKIEEKENKLDNFLANIAVRSGLDQLAFIDNTGYVRGAYGMQSNQTINSPIIAKALRGAPSYTFDSLGDIKYGIIAAIPVREGPNITGVVVASYELASDDEDAYTTIVTENYGVECTVFKGKVRAATTLGANMVGTELDNQHIVQQVLRDGVAYKGMNIINGKEYYSNYTPLVSEDGSITGMIFIAKSMDVIKEVKRVTIMNVVPVTIILIVVLALAGFIFVHWIMNRIKNVSNFLGDLAKGDPDLSKRCAL